MRAATFRSFNPSRWFSSRRSNSWEPLPSDKGQNGSARSPIDPFKASFQNSRVFNSINTFRFDSFNPHFLQRQRTCRIPIRIILITIVFFLLVLLLGGGSVRRPGQNAEDEAGVIREKANKHYWEAFARLDGYYNGVRTLVKMDEWTPEAVQMDMRNQPRRKRDLGSAPEEPLNKRQLNSPLPLEPEVYDPYPSYQSSEYLRDYYPVKKCYIDKNETQQSPDIFVYPGVPQHMTLPFFGAYEEFGIRGDVCFERFGRLAPYGYGYDGSEGGLGIGLNSESQGSEAMWEIQPKVNYTGVDWGWAQSRCYRKNKQRFINNSDDSEDEANEQQTADQKVKLPRQAFVLRTWTGFQYTPHEILTLRSFVNELALKSGGEYDVHLLLHVKDDTIPIWSSKEVYRKVIEDNVPQEFWGITTLWSVELMRLYYPGPFTDPYANVAGQDIHGVYRSAHFALQWFAKEHPEYDYVWNWEMDIRYSGHNYEFHQAVAGWARDQPRRGLWERNSKFWIPSYHGSWKNYTKFIDDELQANGEAPIWGPLTFPNQGDLASPIETKPPHRWQDDDFSWGVGEEADLITFNPIFDPGKTNWVFREDISGYDLNEPIPPRRCAIVTVARLSRRLLNLMHEETYISKHSAFPEMWPPTVALHHGLKAVYIPHAVYFDRKWDLEYMNSIFNYPETAINSPFGWGEHNWLGSSFYYNSGFSGALWRRWLGERENNEGGAREETEGTGRMCLRSTLHHPIKNEDLPTD